MAGMQRIAPRNCETMLMHSLQGGKIKKNPIAQSSQITPTASNRLADEAEPGLIRLRIL